MKRETRDNTPAVPVAEARVEPPTPCPVCTGDKPLQFCDHEGTWYEAPSALTWRKLMLEAIAKGENVITIPAGNLFSMPEVDAVDVERMRARRLEVAHAVPFPSVALRGLLGQIARFLAQDTRCAPEHIYMALMTYVGHLMQERVRLEISKRITVRPQLYTLLIDKPSGGKGTAVKIAGDLIRQLPPELGLCEWGEFNSAEGLVGVVEDRRKELGGTPNVDLILAPDEFSGVVKKAGIDNAVLSEMLNSLYEKKSYSTAVKATRVEINGMRLSLLSTIQDKLWDQVGRQLVDNGFTSRLLLVPRTGEVPRVSEWIPEVDEEKRQGYVRELATRLEAVMKGYTYTATDAAKTKWDKLAWGLPADADAAARLNSIGRRLMLLVAFDLGKKEVDEEVIEVVSALQDWQLAVRLDLTPIEGATKEAQCANAIIRLVTKKPRTRRDFDNAGLAKTYGPQMVDRTLEALLKNTLRINTGGRSEKYEMKG